MCLESVLMADGEQSDQILLQRTVIANSQADSWSVAKTEWKLVSIYDKVSRCICKHKIIENCVIRNRINNNQLIVGNVCVNHFKEEQLSVPKSSRISLKKLHHGTGIAKANRSLINVAVRLNILTTNEGEWYIKARTDSQCSKKEINLESRQKINSLIRLGFTDKRPLCDCGELAKPRQNSTTKGYFYSCYHGRYVNEKWSSQCNFSRNVEIK